jgi:hypothetical protein
MMRIGFDGQSSAAADAAYVAAAIATAIARHRMRFSLRCCFLPDSKRGPPRLVKRVSI